MMQVSKPENRQRTSGEWRDVDSGIDMPESPDDIESQGGRCIPILRTYPVRIALQDCWGFLSHIVMLLNLANGISAEIGRPHV